MFLSIFFFFFQRWCTFFDFVFALHTPLNPSGRRRPSKIGLLLKERISSSNILLDTLFCRTKSSPELMLSVSNMRLLNKRLYFIFITYDRVAASASPYKVTKTYPPTFIQTDFHSHKDYYRFTFFPRSVTNWIALPAHIPVRPTMAHFSSAVCLSLNISF